MYKYEIAIVAQSPPAPVKNSSYTPFFSAINDFHIAPKRNGVLLQGCSRSRILFPRVTGCSFRRQNIAQGPKGPRAIFCLRKNTLSPKGNILTEGNPVVAHHWVEVYVKSFSALKKGVYTALCPLSIHLHCSLSKRGESPCNNSKAMTVSITFVESELSSTRNGTAPRITA